MRDTTPDARARVVAAIRARPRGQRLADCIAFSEEMRELAIARLARRHPGEHRRALIARLMRQAESSVGRRSREG